MNFHRAGHFFAQRCRFHSSAATTTATATTATTSATSAAAAVKPPSKELQAAIGSILRVNQAGELGANAIYKGQLLVLGNDKICGPIIKHMWQQEIHHLNTFNQLIPKFRARPSLLYPLWEMAGYVVGVGSALLGKQAAMACTEAVETVIGNHYNDQLRMLIQVMDNTGNENTEQMGEIRKLTQTIKEFRDDEMEHLDTAVDHDARSMKGYSTFNTIIQGGCKVAIAVAKRV